LGVPDADVVVTDAPLHCVVSLPLVLPGGPLELNLISARELPEFSSIECLQGRAVLDDQGTRYELAIVALTNVVTHVSYRVSFPILTIDIRWVPLHHGYRSESFQAVVREYFLRRTELADLPEAKAVLRVEVVHEDSRTGEVRVPSFGSVPEAFSVQADGRGAVVSDGHPSRVGSTSSRVVLMAFTASG
jgi:hypothetical protein